ncbi:MAG TPA: gfo/Idh/MocA family oxidoreductase, partial [Arthrobacter sp.]
HVLGWEHTFTHEIRDFLVAIDAGTPPSPSFQDGLAVQRILAAVEDSAAAGSARFHVHNSRAAAAPATVTEGA